MCEEDVKTIRQKLKEYSYTITEINQMVPYLQKVIEQKGYDIETVSSNIDAWLYFYQKEEGFSEKEMIRMTKRYPNLLLPPEDNPYFSVKDSFKKYGYTDFEFQLAIIKSWKWFQKKPIEIEQRLELFRVLKMKQVPIVELRTSSLPMETICARALYLSKKKNFSLNTNTLHYLFMEESVFKNKIMVSSEYLVETYHTNEIVEKIKKKVSMERSAGVQRNKQSNVLLEEFLDTHKYSSLQKRSIRRFYARLTSKDVGESLLNFDDNFMMLQDRGLTMDQAIQLTSEVPELLYNLDSLQCTETIFQAFGYTNEQFLSQIQCSSVGNMVQHPNELAQRLILLNYFELDPDLAMQYDITAISLEQLYARYQYLKTRLFTFETPRQMRYLFEDFNKLPSFKECSEEWLEKNYPLPSIFRKLSFVEGESIDYNQVRIRFAMLGYADEVYEILRQHNLVFNAELTSLLDEIEQAGITTGTVPLLQKNQPFDFKKVHANFLEKQALLRCYYNETQVKLLCSRNRELFTIGTERLEACLNFYKEVELLEVPLCKFRSLHQSLETTYSRYQYLRAQGVTITLKNVSSLYLSAKDFEAKFGIQDKQLREIYRRQKTHQVGDYDRNILWYTSDYDEKQNIFKQYHFDPVELKDIYQPDTLLYKMKPADLKRYFTLLNCLQIRNSEMPLSLYLNQEIEQTYARYFYLRKEKRIEFDKKTLYQLFVGEDLFETMHGVTDRAIQKTYSVDQFFQKLSERKRKVKGVSEGRVLRFPKRIS